MPALMRLAGITAAPMRGPAFAPAAPQMQSSFACSGLSGMSSSAGAAVEGSASAGEATESAGEGTSVRCVLMAQWPQHCMHHRLVSPKFPMCANSLHCVVAWEACRKRHVRF